MKLSELEGQRLAGRFQLGRLLGQGGYGAVFEAEQVSMGRRCAVKVMAPHRVSSPETVKRFELEARNTSRLNHPNTVIVYDFGRDEETDLLFLAMEFLEGVDLNHRIQERGPMTISETVHVVNQMAGSLQDAHDHGLVHRDIKPQNVMITTRGADPLFVKVIDFGITKALKASKDGRTGLGLTETGMVLGTPQYMSPEQLRSNEIDGRSDQYSVAISVYRMMTGRTPFGGESPVDAALKHITEMPLPLRTYRPGLDVPVQFEKVLLKALSKEQDDRFPTIVDFAEALAEAADFDGNVVHSAPAAESWAGSATEVVSFDERGQALVPSDELSTQDDVPGATMVVDAYSSDASASAPSAPAEPSQPSEPTGVTKAEPFKKINTVRLGEVGGDTAGIAAPPEEESSVGGGTAGIPRQPAAPAPGLPSDSSSSRTGPSRGLIALVAVALVVLLGTIGLAVVFSGDEAATAGESVGTLEGEPETTALEEPAESSDDPPADNVVFVDEPADEPDEPSDSTQEAEAAASATEKEEKSTPDAPKSDSKSETEAKTAAKTEAASESKGDPIKKAEDEPPKKVVEKGTARVFVVPWGTLYVDGRRYGDKPRQTVRLAPGTYNFELRQGGKVKDSKRARVSSGRSITVQLNAN